MNPFQISQQTTFPTEGLGKCIIWFQSLLTDITGSCYDHGNAISREDFADGYSFDTSADLCPKTYLDPIDKGGFKHELQFGSALPQAVNIIIYAEL